MLVGLPGRLLSPASERVRALCLWPALGLAERPTRGLARRQAGRRAKERPVARHPKLGRLRLSISLSGRVTLTRAGLAAREPSSMAEWRRRRPKVKKLALTGPPFHCQLAGWLEIGRAHV